MRRRVALFMLRRVLLPILLTALGTAAPSGGPAGVQAAPPTPGGSLSPGQQQRRDQAVQELAQAKQELLRAITLSTEGKYAEAQAKLESLLPIMETLVGAQDSFFGEVLNQLGAAHMQQGRYGLAEAYFLRALQIFRADQGELSRGTGAVLNNLGLLYTDLFDKPHALSFHAQGLRAREAALGPSDPDVAASLVNLAKAHMTWQAWDQAVPLLTRALQIQEATVGGDNLVVVNTLLHLAEIYLRQGRYEQAEPLQARAVRIFEKHVGTRSPQLAHTLGGIAALATEEGDYERAEPLLQRAVNAVSDAQGRNQLVLADLLAKLAKLKLHLGSPGQLAPLQQAEMLLQRAIRLAEPFGEHEKYQCRLGEVYLLQGDLPRAEEALQKCRVLPQKDGTWRLLADPDGLHAAAVLDRERGQPQRALSFEEYALTARKTQQGENHPGVAQSYQSLAALRALLGQYDASAHLLQESLKLTERRLRTQGSVLSERRLASLLALLREHEEQLYSLLLRAPTHQALRQLALTALLLRKGRSVDELSLTSLLQSQIKDRADQRRLEELHDLHSRLAHLALQSSERIPLAQREQLFKELSAQAESIEQDLATRLAPLRERRQVLDLEPGPGQIVTQVAAALPPGAALVEMVAFTERPPDQKLSAPDGPLHYLAFILARDAIPEVVDLGRAAPIELMAGRLQAALSNPKAEYLVAAQDAYRRLFAPLLTALRGRRRVVISPDGVLDLVPFAALHDGQRFILSDYDISYVTSGRDLVRSDRGPGGPSRIVVVADPAFGSPLVASAVGTRGTSQRDRGLQLGSLRPLPGTRQEALAIQKLWPQAQLLLGADATEPALLGLVAPTVLHIATHGIFLADAPPPAARGLGLDRGFDAVSEPLPPNPLLRSALVLAGAQDRFARTAVADRTDAAATADGLATALEVSGMNLWGTELVVLSACDSGRGDVLPGQGVYGLRRGLAAAGAETVVTSLWRLNDRLTVDLMSRYYQGLRAGEGRVAALRTAALAAQVEHPHPYYWASFIAIGQAAPLRSAR